MKQVDRKAYSLQAYAHPERFASYFHQLEEALAFEPRSILEVGVGDGVFGDFIKTNTDIAYTSLDIAEDLHPDKVGSVESIPFPDKSFDLVCAFQVLEHIPFEKLPQALSELARVARSGALVTLPHYGPAFKFLVKIPFVPEIRFAFKLPFPRMHVWNGQHYWEIGKRGYPASKIAALISEHFTIRRQFIPFGNQYHHFYVLEALPVNK